jgi:CrcB protein
LSPVLQLLVVGAGGFVGSILRFAIGGAVQRAVPVAGFPLGILVVNLIGCFGIGMLSGWAESREFVTAEMRLFLVVGLLGGFTTYSTFANDGVAMLRDDAFGEALATVALHVIGGFAAVWLGHRLTSID